LDERIDVIGRRESVIDTRDDLVAQSGEAFRLVAVADLTERANHRWAEEAASVDDSAIRDSRVTDDAAFISRIDGSGKNADEPRTVVPYEKRSVEETVAVVAEKASGVEKRAHRR
jgi:hypothetical protein